MYALNTGKISMFNKTPSTVHSNIGVQINLDGVDKETAVAVVETALNYYQSQLTTHPAEVPVESEKE